MINKNIITLLLYISIICSIIMGFFIIWIIYRVLKIKTPIIFPSKSETTNNTIK